MSLTIRRSGNLIEVVGGAAYEQILRPELVYTHRVSYHGKELNQRKKFIEQERSAGRNPQMKPHMDFFERELYAVTPSGSLACPAGLTHRVTRTLDTMGIPWDFVDLRSRSLPPADFARLLEIPGGMDFRYRQDEVLACIDGTSGCIIDAPTGYGKSHIAVRLPVIYPKSRIVLVSPGLDLVKGLYGRLQSVGVFDVGRVGGGFHEPEARVTLASADSLHRVYMEKADLLVYDECHTAGSPEKLQQLARYTEAKMIGFTASPTRGDGAFDAVEAVFGPVQLRISYQEAVQHNVISEIRVLMVEIENLPGYKNGHDGEAWKRKAYWRNDGRNAIIAAALKQIVPQHLVDPDPQTLVMVETVDHAYELRKHLPDFQIVYATLEESRIEKFEKRGLWRDGETLLKEKDRTELRKQFEDGTLRKAISTFVWKQGVNFVNLPLLVRADGGDGDINNIQIPGRLSRLSDGKKYGLLVDFIDKFDDKAHRRSQGRMADYRSLGWDIMRVSVQVNGVAGSTN